MIKLTDSQYGIIGIMRDGERIGTAYLSKRYRPAYHVPVGYVTTIKLKSGKTIREVSRTIPEAKRKLVERVRW